jgi:hypothetical protein
MANVIADVGFSVLRGLNKTDRIGRRARISIPPCRLLPGRMVRSRADGEGALMARVVAGVVFTKNPKGTLRSSISQLGGPQKEIDGTRLTYDGRSDYPM